MAIRAAWFIGSLILVTLAGMLLVSPAVQAETTDGPGSVSPSQESRARINALRANEFFYQSYGKTDPFQVLVSGEYEQTSASDVVDINAGRRPCAQRTRRQHPQEFPDRPDHIVRNHQPGGSEAGKPGGLTNVRKVHL